MMKMEYLEFDLMGIPKPDITFVLSVKPEVSYQNIINRGRETDENESLENLTKSYENLEYLCKTRGYVLVDCCKLNDEGKYEMLTREEILDKVLAACNSKEVRPLGDKIIVSGIAQETYDIELVYYTTEAEESDTVNEVEGEGGAIERYNAWQCGEIGRAINPDRLRSEILKSDIKPVGADYVEIIKPTYTTLAKNKVAKWSGNMNVTHKTTAPGA